MAAVKSASPLPAGTKVSFHQVYVANHEEFLVPHVQNGWVQVFASDYVGGGADLPWLVRYAVVEPATQAEVDRSVAEGAYLSRIPRVENDG